jgi:hypothetical protein
VASAGRRLLAESVVLPPYSALHRSKRYAALETRLQYDRYLRVLTELHGTLEASPLRGLYTLSGGLLLGYRREGRALPWDCWDIDFELPHEHLPVLAASLPALAAAGWRHRVTWAHNGGEVAEVRFIRKLVGLDFFVTYPRGGDDASWVFARQHGRWVQAEQRIPRGGTKAVEFLGLRWLVPDPVEVPLAAMYGAWSVPDPTWDYMQSPAIVSTMPWTNPPVDWPGHANGP